MKKKIIAILLTITCLLAFNGTASAVLSSNSKDGLGSYTLTNPSGFKSGLYASADFGSVKAYCMEPGKNPVANGVDCNASVLNANDEFAKAAMYIFSSDKSESLKGTAIRIVALVTGDGALGNWSKESKDVARQARCGYIRAAYKAAEKAGVTVKSSGLTGYTSKGGVNCATSFDVRGEVIDFAAEALKAAKTTTAGGEKPTVTVSSAGGKATIKVDNSKGTSEAELTIQCTKAKGDGCNKTNKIAAGKTASFNIETEVNNSEQCGTFTADLKYKAGKNAGSCTEVTKFSCGSLQDYAGCSNNTGKPSTDPGSGKDGEYVTEHITDPNNPGSTTISLNCDGKPEPKKKECNLTDTPEVKKDDGLDKDAICKADGSTVIFIGEGSLYTKDDETIENCLINDKQGHLVAKSDLCATYCTEDYSFKSSGLALSDKDYVDGQFVITAGSYFNFKDGKAYEEAKVTCVTEIDMDAYKTKVKTAAQTYISNFDEEEHVCIEKVNTDGTKFYEETAFITKNTANISDSYKVTFSKDTSEKVVKTYTEAEKSTCVSNAKANTIKGVGDANGASGKYKEAVTSLTSELNSCVTTAQSNNYIDDKCNSTVTFDYGYNVEPYDLTKNKTEEIVEENLFLYNCNGAYSTTNCKQSKDAMATANLDLGISGGNITISATEYVRKDATKTITYSLEGIGICNNYNDGTSNYPVSKEECDSKEGTTWAQGWPVSYDTPQGNYSYEVKVDGYGHVRYYDTKECKFLNKYVSDKVAYGCSYTVNGCIDCPFECDPNAQCDPAPDCTGDCPFNCVGVGCIYDPGNGLVLNYQPISMINVDSTFGYLNDRYSSVAAVTEGRNAVTAKANPLAATGTGAAREVKSYNWNTTKGQATINSIESRGEEIYAGDPEYAVTLSPATIKDIKKTNNEEGNSYLNQSLQCKNIGNDYVVCESTFLKELAEKGILTVRNAEGFKSIDDITSDVIPAGKTIVAEKKSGTGPAWK